MNGNQYNNIIEKTLSICSNDQTDLDITRVTLNNMGVPLPQGDTYEVKKILSTNDYMYWRSCSVSEAQEYANAGIPTICIDESTIALVHATETADGNSVLIESTKTSALELDTVSYYSYSNANTSSTVGSSCSTTTTIQTSGSIKDGLYYFNNNQHGRYLRKKSSNIVAESGTMNALGKTSIKWKITYNDGYYVIKSVDGTNVYLGVPTNRSSNNIEPIESNNSSSNRCKWKLSVSLIGGMLLKNAYNNYYLACSENGLCTRSSTGFSNSPEYSECVWRMANTSYYGNTGTEDKQELTSDFTFDFSDFAVGDIVSPKVDTPKEVLWASAADFKFSVPNEYIQIDETKHTLKAIKSGNVLITVTHKVTGISKNFSFKIHKAAIIIVPGIMGSVLVSGSNSNFPSGTVLWDLSLWDDYQNDQISLLEVKDRICELSCDSDGSSRKNVLALNNNYGTGNIYKPLYDFLENHFGAMYDVKFFAYDWRLSNETSAQKLNEFIQNNSFKRVVLVCHSMGGLVASSYLTIGEQQRKSVQKLVMLGSPLLGTSVVPYLWGSEDLNATGLLDSFGLSAFWETLLDYVALFYNVLDAFIGNFSSLYELFPSKKYFDSEYANKSYLIASMAGFSPFECTTYSETKIRLEAYLPKYNKTLASKAEQLHDSFYTAYEQHITYKVDSYYIAGYNLDTVDKIETTGWDWYIDSKTDDGDGTVATWSATLGDKYYSKTYFVKNVGHIDLVNNDNVKTFIKNIINNDTSTSQFDNIFSTVT